MIDTLDLSGFEPLLQSVHAGLLARSLTVATAESCTGGLLSMLLTTHPGSSKYFLGGAATYSNAAKTRILKIEASLIDKCGAVSEQVGTAMALGAQRLFESDIGIGVTGIAGPGGASPGKPVGTVWLALAYNGKVSARNLMLTGTRDQIRFGSAYEALKSLGTIVVGER